MNVKAQDIDVAIAQPSTAVKPLASLHPAVLVVCASLFVALCAHFSVPLPFSPVPFSMQDLAVLLVGLALGPALGCAALLLYLAEGAVGFPFFTPGPGGIAQLLGPTGGYLIAYPFVAYIAGAIFAKARQHKFLFALAACTVAQIVLFATGGFWLSLATHSLAHAALLGIVPFLPLAAVKILLASTAATRFGIRGKQYKL
ncbi:MAG: biotin transporter BioY [Acidobacteriaceae bacterium]